MICLICGGRGKRAYYDVKLDEWIYYKCWTCNGRGEIPNGLCSNKHSVAEVDAGKVQEDDKSRRAEPLDTEDNHGDN